MTFLPLDRHRRILVMGLGHFGGNLGAARFWAELGAEVTVTDAAPEASLRASVEALRDLPVRFVLGRHDEADFKRADLVMASPAVAFDHPLLALARAAGAEILTEIGLVWRLAHGAGSPLLAVTGSNGKSTTTALLGEMVRARHPDALVGGNLGGSLLPDLAGHPPSAPLVLELSSFQLHYLAGQQPPPAPRVAVVANLSPNHLDWHKTTLHYYESKRHLLRHQTPDDFVVLNAEDPTLRRWAEDAPARLLWTAPDDPGDADAAFVRDDGDGPWILLRLDGAEHRLAPLSNLSLPSRHNTANAVQAAAAAWLFTRDADAVAAGLERFGGLPHRLETVARARGVRFVNDSKATTPEAAALALASFAGAPVVALAGGYDKGIDLAPMIEALRAHAAGVVLMGATEAALAKGLEGAPMPVERAGTDFEAAFARAAGMALGLGGGSCCCRRGARVGGCSAITRSGGTASGTWPGDGPSKIRRPVRVFGAVKRREAP